MLSITRQFRYGTRSLAKSPTLSLVAILALTLGIGLTTIMYSIVYGALMKGLPFDEPDQIVAVGRANPALGSRRQSLPIHDLMDLRAQQHSMTTLAGYYTGTMNLSGAERAERYDGAFMTANSFSILRVRPLLGRTFRDGEDAPGAERVVVLGYDLWKNRYASDRAIIGKTIRVNGEPTVVIGVMPEKFLFPERQELWIPTHMNLLKIARGEGDYLNVFGRLKPGVSIEQASMDLAAVAGRLAKEYPKTNEGVTSEVEHFTDASIGDGPKRLLYTMLGAVGFVLLIACANVANLLIGRAAHRSKEVGIRTALGASRATVIGQFLAESTMLSLIGAVCGIVVAYFGIRLFNASIASTQPPFWIDIRLHPPVLWFALIVTALTSFLSGVIPAVQASKVDINSILKDESRGSSSFAMGRLSKGLVMMEMALSCGLLVAAGLMIKSVTKLRTIDFGFTTEDVFTARVGLNEVKYADSTKQLQFFNELATKLAAIPGADVSGLTLNLPALGSNFGPLAKEGTTYQKERDIPRGHFVAVTPGFFDVFRAKPISGRLIQETDHATTLRVAVINRSLGQKLFPGEDPVGRRVRFGGLATKAPWLTIVGVVPDLYMGGADNKDPQGLYVPFEQNPQRYVSVAIRTRGDANALAPLVRNAVASIDADQPIYFVRTLATSVAEQNWHYRIFGSLFMVFGIVALFLASIGLYAVMSFSVSRRTREMGVRMALGARERDVVSLILRQGMTQIAVGMAVGLVIALGVSRLLALALFGVNPRDPVVFGGVVIVLSVAAALACLVPAMRATRIDPMIALRTD
ncbi:MAG: ABC transporter permease [Gemmatimonadota bacterium]|nr:ABC transporter permease [Gemmatimonadota bacterium]